MGDARKDLAEKSGSAPVLIVRNVLIDPSQVEDILQEAFAKVILQNKLFSTEQESYNYIRRTVLNTMIDLVPRSKATLRPGAGSQAGPLVLLIHSKEKKLKALIISELRKNLKDFPPH